MDKSRNNARMKPQVYFPGMGSPKENEIRRVEFEERGMRS